MSSACVDEDCGHFWNLQKELQKEIIPGVVLIAVYSAAAVSTVPRGSAREELTPQTASVATVPRGSAKGRINTTDCFSSYGPVDAVLCIRRGL